MNSGSPIEARIGGGYINIIIIGAIIIGILALIYVVYRVLTKKFSTPEWIEAQKKKPLTSKDLNQATKDLNLTSEERDLLWEIGHKYTNVNIIYLVQDAESFCDTFKQRYKDFIAANASQRQLSALFSLKNKMENFYKNEVVITSTKNIENGQMLQFADKAGVRCTATISENRPEGLLLAIPDNLAKGQNRPDSLSRVVFSLTSPNGISYALTSRVVRYQQNNSGAVEMLISHTNDVKQLQRRQTDRTEITTNCMFSAVRVSSDSSKKNDISYTPLQQKYKGLLKDISSEGCSLQAGLPIRDGQYIHLEFNLPYKTDNVALGIITSTDKSDLPGKFLLHIQFVKVETETKNTILAMVNKFI